MIQNHKVLGVILARGGSKGVPRKNVLDLAGKPLIAWTIEAALDAEYIDDLILSSDDDEIMSVAREHGCQVPFRRPEALARDDSTSIDALLHALDETPGYDYVVLLQPTSPLRTAADINAAVRACTVHDAPACVTVTPAEEPPQWMFTLDANQHLSPLFDDVPLRRQDAPDVYVLNGAVYVARVEWLRETRTFLHEDVVAVPMPRERSVDIDAPVDITIAEALLRAFNASAS